MMKPFNELKIAVCSDHAGYELKCHIIDYLRTKQAGEVMDCGTHSADSVDYPDFAHPLAHAVSTGRCDLGIACCGSGKRGNGPYCLATGALKGGISDESKWTCF